MNYCKDCEERDCVSYICESCPHRPNMRFGVGFIEVFIDWFFNNFSWFAGLLGAMIILLIIFN